MMLSNLSSLNYLYIFFGEMSIQAHCSIFNQVVLSYLNSLCILDINPPIRHMVWKYSLSFNRLFLYSIDWFWGVGFFGGFFGFHFVFLCFAAAFLSNQTSIACAFDVISMKPMPRQCQDNFPMFSSSFTASGLRFIESILSWYLYIVWDKSPVSFFCMKVSSFPNTVHWRGSPFPTVYSGHLVKNQLTINA